MRSFAEVARLFFSCFLLSTSLLATSVFTKTARLDGKIVQQNASSVTLQLANGGSQQTIPRESILTIYDDDGVLVWSSPSIAQADPTPERVGEKIALADTTMRSKYRGVHLGATGAYGMGYGNATFSTYPLATGPDYRPLFELGGAGAWYWSDSNALTFAVGFADRKLPVKGLVVPNVGAGNAYWATQYVDIRTGYRLQSDIFFVELGVLAAIKAANTPLNLETASSTLSLQYASATQRSFAALSVALGFNYALSQDLFLSAMARIDHGVSTALSVNVATAADTSGNVISSAPLSIVPLFGTIQLGAFLRL